MTIFFSSLSVVTSLLKPQRLRNSLVRRDPYSALTRGGDSLNPGHKLRRHQTRL